MADYKTMRVPEAAWEAARDAKQDGETWGEYLQRCADVDTASTAAPEVVEASVDTDEITESIKNEISMAADPTVEVDTDGLIREIEKLQELVERVPEDTAEKFREKYA